MALSLAGCQGPGDAAQKAGGAREFPEADRPVSPGGLAAFSTEVERDSMNEAEVVMNLAEIEPGMTVADIGAGAGYYTIRLAQRVGSKGRVLAEDIDATVIRELGLRVERERLANVSIKQGTSDDPSLPENSFDRIFLVHMYHEVAEPYAFLWNLRPALRQGGKVIVVDVDRASDAHGLPPELLFCEFAALGFRLSEFVRKAELQGYYAQFEAVGGRPGPAEIVPCRLSGETGQK
ncbi:class I SAM-dependent methyltransferase [Novosphingobium aureum]|uniref:class I SAM-dependent methyltransferase n=1 Tax=Novosphingobium aureum TaxID=2792964 RepID=UPI001E3DBBC6|nr:class I SAM-dependent methyltransferase [Novosphingobium aureum]